MVLLCILLTFYCNVWNIAACVNEFFYGEIHVSDGDVESSEDTIYKGYNAVLDSKSTDETLVSSYLSIL